VQDVRFRTLVVEAAPAAAQAGQVAQGASGRAASEVRRARLALARGRGEKP
jgi:hypothetical protein